MAAPSQPSQPSKPSLVRALAACFEADPLINEYDFVPLLPPSSNDDAAASSFLVESHKLAISAAALKPLFQEAHMAFKAAAATGHHLLDITRALLLVNPDVYTAWNARKRLVAAGAISEASELAFVDLVFSKHTKKACAWAHRRWCLARLWGTAEQDGDSSSSTVAAQEAHELGLTASIAERFPKNYYAWTHRWWVVKAGAKRRRIGSGAAPWLEAQAAFGVEWVERHAWDFSAAGFLLQALAAWAKEQDGGKAVEKRLRGMLEAGARQLDQCPGHESLWYRRRGLFALWAEQQQQQRQQRWPAAAMTLPSPASKGEGGLASYPPSLSSTVEGVGACLGWELEMATYYQAGQGPFYTEASGGLLWEAAARRRQRRCAWAHARWVLELVQRSCQEGQGSAVEIGGWARQLAEGLEVVRREAGFVPPGYGKLAGQLVGANVRELV